MGMTRILAKTHTKKASQKGTPEAMAKGIPPLTSAMGNMLNKAAFIMGIISISFLLEY